MRSKPIHRLRVALFLVGALSLLFGITLNASAQTTVLCAMKTISSGYFYVPSILGLSHIRIEMLFSSQQLFGDQNGGTSPYVGTIGNWPDGIVNIYDLIFIASFFGSYEGSAYWNYLADVVPDKTVDIYDLITIASSFGGSGTYMLWPQPGVTVLFNNVGTPQSPDGAGFVIIPTGATSFTVRQNGNAIGAVITFWK